MFIAEQTGERVCSGRINTNVRPSGALKKRKHPCRMPPFLFCYLQMLRFKPSIIYMPAMVPWSGTPIAFAEKTAAFPNFGFFRKDGCNFLEQLRELSCIIFGGWYFTLLWQIDIMRCNRRRKDSGKLLTLKEIAELAGVSWLS